MLKRKFFGGCLGGLLAVALLSGVALFVFSVVFNQSQADAQNTQATSTAVVIRRTKQPSVTQGLATQPSLLSAVSPAVPDVGVTIEYAASATPVPTQTAYPTDVSSSLATSVMPVIPATPTPGMLALGTSSYPLTVTSEVMLAQTHVAHYQDSVGATRTAVEAESQSVFATLTARVPIQATP